MNNLRQISVILYRLKRDFGSPIQLRNPNTSSVNRETGVVDLSYDSISIPRAIVLPAKAVPSFVYDLSYLTANKNFSYGGFFGSHTRTIIVDGKDLVDDFLIKEKTEAIFEESVHILKDFNPTVTNKSYLLTVTTLSSLEKVDE